MKKLLGPTAAGLLLLASAPAVHAQSTDGYHSIQVFPMVVDSASYAQQFFLSTPNLFPVTVKAKFFPGKDTEQATIGPLTCNEVVIPANGGVTVDSLRTLCPGLVPDKTAYGFLHLQAKDSSDGMVSDIPVFSAFARTSNPQGLGFSSEAFPAHTFTSATTVVTGLRRLAATAGSPAFQTNCFIGNLNQLEPAETPVAKQVTYTLLVGSTEYTGTVSLLPGQLVRYLDIYKTAGAPDGDYQGNAIIFRAITGGGRPGLLTYCTVQDNSSFGADFRIGKQAYGSMGIGSNDGTANRELLGTQDVQGRKFEIGPGSQANTHVVYFKHPDTVQCMLLDPTTYTQLSPAYGLEMRASDSDQLEAVGGDDQTGTGLIYLGDKPQHGGYNNRYLIEVESNETNEGATRPYALYCSSGSGHTFGYDIIKYQEAIDRF